MIEKLKELRKWLSDMYTVHTQDVIDRIDEIIKEEPQNEEIPVDEQLYASALAYLKSIKYKWAHFLKWEKLLEVARKSWFEW